MGVCIACNAEVADEQGTDSSCANCADGEVSAGGASMPDSPIVAPSTETRAESSPTEEGDTTEMS